jgi:hypothetical protein
MPLREALSKGNLDTSSAPSMPAGLGPKIKNATVAEIIREKI